MTVRNIMKKKVAILVWGLRTGGAERIAGLLSKFLAKIYEVYVFVNDDENIIYEYGGRIVRIGSNVEDEKVIDEVAVAHLKEKLNIDVAISFLEPMNIINIKSRRKERVIISERCAQSRMIPKDDVLDTDIKRFYNYSDEIVACSHGVAYDLVEQYEVKSDKITTIYNFIDKETILRKAELDRDKDIKDFLNGHEYFISIGRLENQKNQKRLILQFYYFNKRINDGIKLLILGSGKKEGELRKLIYDLNLEKSVGIFQFEKNPFPYIKGAKVLVSATKYEGLPNAYLESMLLGCPIISTDCIAGPRELLLDENNYSVELANIKICTKITSKARSENSKMS